MHSPRQFNAEVLEGESVLDALRRVSLLSDKELTEAAAKGAVWVSLRRGRGSTRPRRLRSMSSSVSPGSSVMLNYNPQVLASQPQPMWCVSDQVNYGIWFKPAGMLCQGSKWSDHTTATAVAAGMRSKPCFLVHRLDRAACGLLVLAYTKNSLRALADMFAAQKIAKTYLARVSGELSLDLPLIIETPVDEKSAITTLHDTLFDSATQTSRLRLSIATGRKHQIRKHLAAIGYPILGDRLYAEKHTKNHDEGSRAEDDEKIYTRQLADNSPEMNLQLVANELQFTCPFTRREVIVSIDAEKALAGQLTP